ncbi:FecR domain-containing protein [Alloacidobacterium dinghuense]|uniref:FecR domain-containing protein n=1 Tax=Alloacidobacterium dinghuense TaxID=2763107 RepID=A0A7G8BNK0_9BACT|nr:FecR family protein [Alloacidobacterium dinghuense]QNI34120.1 FecR domain-containing protein [Alloacidobacterium dinghuense]
MRHPENSHRRGWFSSHLVSQLLLTAALASVAYAQETNNVRSVRISHVEGTVQILDDNGVVFDQAHANMPVTEQMHLKTGDDGRAEVQFEDGSVARITPNSAVNFNKLERTSEGSTITQVEATGGLTYYEFNNRGGTYSVRVGPYTVSATKSSIFRVAMDQNPAQVAVMHGSVHIDTGNDGGLDVQTSQTATLDRKDTSSYDVAQNITADSWDQWNSDRDQQLAQMGARATMARAMGGNPDEPAWSDLDYYGNWYDMPGYGMGWMPAGLGGGFDPFGSGYWGYYPSYGYTWISSYPWGWLPYHCGAWNFFNSAGWMWFPGNCGYGAFGNGWYPVATVWNCPPNYLLPKRPITPVRGPVHMPPQQALVAVGHSPVEVHPRITEGGKPIAPPIRFEGKTLSPMEASVQPKAPGPLGQSFSVASGYVAPVRGGSGTLPGEGVRGMYPSSGAIPSGGAPRNTAMPIAPRSTAMPASPRSVAAPPSYHTAPSAGGGGSSHYSAPSSSSSFSSGAHMSAPASSGAASSGASHAH